MRLEMFVKYLKQSDRENNVHIYPSNEERDFCTVGRVIGSDKAWFL